MESERRSKREMKKKKIQRKTPNGKTSQALAIHKCHCLWIVDQSKCLIYKCDEKFVNLSKCPGKAYEH